jgi:hypothetical protein
VRFYWRGTCPPIGRGWVPLLRDLVGEWRRVRWLGGVLLAGSRAAGWVRFAHLYMCVVLCSYIYMSSLCVFMSSLYIPADVCPPLGLRGLRAHARGVADAARNDAAWPRRCHLPSAMPLLAAMPLLGFLQRCSLFTSLPQCNSGRQFPKLAGNQRLSLADLARIA